MAKRRYRRYRRARGRWSSNIQRIRDNYPTISAGAVSQSYTICQNPVQDALTVSNQFTVKNAEASMDIEAYLPNAFENIEYYIMYVPEGYGIDGDLPFKHPEWIMAYKFVGTANTSSDSQTVSLLLLLELKLDFLED